MNFLEKKSKPEKKRNFRKEPSHICTYTINEIAFFFKKKKMDITARKLENFIFFFDSIIIEPNKLKRKKPGK